MLILILPILKIILSHLKIQMLMMITMTLNKMAVNKIIPYINTK